LIKLLSQELGITRKLTEISPPLRTDIVVVSYAFDSAVPRILTHCSPTSCDTVESKEACCESSIDASRAAASRAFA